MALHEKIKIANIIKDLHIYFLERHVTNIEVHTTITKEATIISAILPIDRIDIANEITQQFQCTRDPVLEEYAWEVIIEDNNALELQQLGSLIDHVEVLEATDSVTIQFVRYNT